MAICSNEFYERLRGLFKLPDNLVEFKIIGKVNEIVYVECTTILEISVDDEIQIETKRYKLVETDD